MTDVAAPNERDPEIHEAFLSLACQAPVYANPPLQPCVEQRGVAPEDVAWAVAGRRSAASVLRWPLTTMS